MSGSGVSTPRSRDLVTHAHLERQYASASRIYRERAPPVIRQESVSKRWTVFYAACVRIGGRNLREVTSGAAGPSWLLTVT